MLKQKLFLVVGKDIHSRDRPPGSLKLRLDSCKPTFQRAALARKLKHPSIGLHEPGFESLLSYLQFVDAELERIAFRRQLSRPRPSLFDLFLPLAQIAFE